MGLFPSINGTFLYRDHVNYIIVPLPYRFRPLGVPLPQKKYPTAKKLVRTLFLKRRVMLG
jgi:hypothetical protein